MNEHTKCFAYKNGVCLALDENQCTCKCPFFKTKGELEAGREKAKTRIAKLPYEVQVHIKNSYRREI